MPFIGRQPANAPLTSADIQDGTIQTADIADANITSEKIASGVIPGASNAFRNIIINGDMSIAQRGTSESGITDGGSGYRTMDRWQTTVISSGTWTQSQDTDVPSGQGFSKSLKMDCTTANASLSANSSLNIQGRFEGQNLQYLKKGTSSAESLTMSFWVKSNKTGTYIVEIRDRDNSRDFSKSYTISSADTWEKKTLTYAGDTTGAFDNDNARSLDVLFYLGAGTDFTSGTLQSSWYSATTSNRAVGQVNLADSTANYINITGVQLEAGTTASDFEFLPYDVNFERCRRYCFTVGFTPDGNNFNKESNVGSYYNATTFIVNNYLPTIMRASPSTTFFGGSSAITVYSNGSARTSTSVAQDSVSPSQVAFSVGTSSATSGHVGTSNWGSGDYCLLNAEL